MSQNNWLPHFIKRPRARNARLRDDPSAVFKAFVELLAQLRADARAASHTPINAQAEKS
ncbi:histidine kinase [Methylocystis sp. FS]|uniref:histidine kinase n=1 Tax=Methylocystis silviterrae TaxID=2743612 RepID=UPI001584091E|nr:histidine kinase [Methylocystis silviterrae]NUJ79406.1 histidine kinase [Methylocystis silviterrae]